MAQNLQIFQAKTKGVPGTNYAEVYKKSFSVYQEICRRTKRRPYVRSAYFNKEKIFLGLFWGHLHSKLNYRDKTRRVKLFPCAIELIERGQCHPILTKQSLEQPNTILYRFVGKTPDGKLFFVQIKKDMHSNQKWLISAFPCEN